MYYNMIDQQFLLARTYVSSLEDVVELNNTGINFGQLDGYFERQLQHFTPYQEYKQGHNRYALPLITDEDQNSLVSLQDSGRTELQFKVPTDHVKAVPSLWDFIKQFEYGRAHAIWLKQGGFFPPHRDGPILPNLEQECFRVLITLGGCEQQHFVTIIDNKVAPLKNYRAYYINSFRTHSAFSFTDKCKFIILNFHISLDNVVALRKMIV